MQHPFKALAGILGTAVAIAGVLLIALPSRAYAQMTDGIAPDSILDSVSVPEPATIGLVAVGVVAVAYLRNRK